MNDLLTIIEIDDDRSDRIEQIYQLLLDMQTRMATLENRVSQIETEIKAARPVIEQIPQRLSGVESRMGNVENRISSLEIVFAKLNRNNVGLLHSNNENTPPAHTIEKK